MTIPRLSRGVYYVGSGDGSLTHFFVNPLNDLCIETENYKFYDIVLQKSVNSWTFGNILIGGIIGYSSSAVRRMMLVAPRVKRVPFSMRRRSFGES